MRFSSKPIIEHVEVPLPDENLWEDIVAHWQRRAAPGGDRDGLGNSCYVVSVQGFPPADAQSQLAEIVGLVRGQGDQIVGEEIVAQRRPHPKTFVGQGTARDVAQRGRDAGADLLVFDAELTPSQMRNLEDETGLPVSDREAVILNVFLRNARTRAARAQVEIAHLTYLRPRIRGIGLNMDQQAGGIMGSRGAGETASELLARRLDGRLTDLRRALGKLEARARTQRAHRADCFRIVLLGYTNAGKTSLMNALTGAELSARAQPFETLDTTSRSLARHGGDVLISDTVGFIRRLPQRLLASFESTLAEVRHGSLLVLVVDLSHPEWELHVRTTDEMLHKLGAQDRRRLYVFNKTDQLTAPVKEEVLQRITGGASFVSMSARDQSAVAALREELIAAARSEQAQRVFFVPYQATGAVSLIYSRCRVIRSVAVERGQQLTVEGPPHVLRSVEQILKGAVQ